ncbi:phenylalanine--tRNA ligase subunit beta [Candidatus Methylocalor cossyra]|uniref:Phenylalanine--tRNA ligase beta subunit n=1 Tax=Candidatus Methylocalor cossyra TaxID=3108543 RepID=A0ABM9NKL2_9GAMM
MRFSEAWLRQYVDPPIDTRQLAHQLTMAGLEVDSVEPAAPPFHGVVVGEILEVVPHPQADRLKVCRVAAGTGDPVEVVCGAPNAQTGLKAPLALDGAELPGGRRILRTAVRGVSSCGMLCSAEELGLDEDGTGLLALPADAPVGTDLRTYLQLDDRAITIDLTPNRADCLSVEGIAREVALLNGLDFKVRDTDPVSVTIDTVIPVTVAAPEACPRYLGRYIAGIARNAPTPLWMKERLRRSGVRSVDAVVDVTNYVLLELGQPLHAFDAAALEGGIQVRFAHPGETLRLLNDQDVRLDGDVLVIADQARALALAGVMGGRASAVSSATVDIFLECAFFTPAHLMGKARRYGLDTDASRRFERGVDPGLQARALERASQLILAVAGGKAGPVVEAVTPAHLPRRDPILVRAERIRRLLGLDLEPARVRDILARLGLNPEECPEGWWVTPPGFRFDLAIEADVIEELGRVYGYDRLPRRHPPIPAMMRPVSEQRLRLDRVKDLLVDRGYQEAITYSFVDGRVQELVTPDIAPLTLANPISNELSVMRTSLWPGLLEAALKNSHRQQERIRLFESGLRFARRGDGIEQRPALAALAMGLVEVEQWGAAPRKVDFYDLKADLEALVALTGRSAELRFAKGQLPALHPGQAAEVRLNGERLGWLGMLHPRLEKQLGFQDRVFLFEVDQEVLLRRAVPRFAPLSRFPKVRRDLAVVVDEAVNAEQLVACIEAEGRDILRQVSVFDVYRGQGIEPGKKSVALGLVWQADSETLTDAAVDAAMAAVVENLTVKFDARLRD